MSLTILQSREAIEAAIATMNPIAKEAAQLLAHRLLENPDIIDDQETLGEEWIQACAISCARAGINPHTSLARFESFLENHGSAVLNVAFSIAVFIMRDAERQQKWGWVGKAAAVAVGVALGSFFG